MSRDDGRAEVFEHLARVAKALGSGRRMELVDLLAQGERSVEALARATGMNVTTASAHLQSLRRAHLVATRREGTRVHYRLAGPDVVALYLQVQRVAQARLPDLEAARRNLVGPGEAEEIDRDELWRRVQDGTVTVVDVRPPEEYARGHIPGALSIPLERLAEHLAELPAATEVVAYCRGPYCVLAHDAVRLLRAHGRPARRLADGVPQWSAARLPVVTAG